LPRRFPHERWRTGWLTEKDGMLGQTIGLVPNPRLATADIRVE
jgi:hypothetical protein